jgi:DNA-binding NtrC family response regulator
MMDFPSLRILVAEDEADVRNALVDALGAAGHETTGVGDGEVALERVEAGGVDLVIADVRMPKVDGLTLLRRSLTRAARPDFILMTSFGDVSDAVAALKDGARDYLTKPFEVDELVLRVSAIAERRGLQRQLESARAQLAASSGTQLVGESAAIRHLIERIDVVAESDAAVLITGETGTGKELVARRIHAMSPRAAGPFVAVNCAAFPETLLEPELFGHVRGAFTGAVRAREGRFKAADRGTLLLDEVAEMPPSAQAKLLRVLQDGVVEPLGTNAAVRVDVRILSSTHRDLRRRMADGRFREDLFYRLDVVEVQLPPLRERPGDLPLLVSHFLRLHLPAAATLPDLSSAAWQALAAYRFPGNVRELGHAIHQAVVLSRGGTIQLEHLPEDISRLASRSDEEREVRPLAMVLREAERDHLLRALGVARGKRVRAAELLGISRKNLWEKLRAHGLSDADDDGSD